MPWLASTSRPTMRRSSRSPPSSSRIGCMTRHGPHQAAQKSTRTGRSDSRTTASKSASVTWVTWVSWVMPVTVAHGARRVDAVCSSGRVAAVIARAAPGVAAPSPQWGVAMAELSPQDVFAGCRIEGVLGRGGMGVIYRATELRLGRPVALKLIATEQASDPDVRDRFEREARLTAAIDHPNVIPVYAAGEEDGHLYLVMRYVPGTDLQALLRRDGRLAPARAASIVAQVGEALDAAHAAGLVHRDVKPANVLIAGEHAYLSDFGITRVQSAETRITDSGGWIGTVDFMAPEHLRGEPTDARSDVYALGCVLHAALTGTPPYRRETVPATITAHLHELPPRPSETLGVPVAFDSVIARALAKDPAHRYPSAGDLGRAARAAAVGQARATARGSVATGAATPEHAEPTRIAPAAGATAVVAPAAMATAIADRPADRAGGARGGSTGGTAAPPPPPPRLRLRRTPRRPRGRGGGARGGPGGGRAPPPATAARRARAA